jgi:hypothetical protein
MSVISEKALVRAPLASAGRLLDRFMAAHRANDDGGARLVLRAHELEKPAIVSLTAAHRPGDMTPRYDVHWKAEGGGTYPEFNGQLTIGGDSDYETFWLELNGDYKPPLGIVGQVFDAVVGNRIATETARGLLDDMRGHIENEVQDEEARKPRA